MIVVFVTTKPFSPNKLGLARDETPRVAKMVTKDNEKRSEGEATSTRAKGQGERETKT